MTPQKTRTHSVVISVPCPKCGAKAEKPCMKASGNQAETHIERMDEYNKRVKM